MNLGGLLPWYRANQREMPWRSNPTPYCVWVSEMMLQQTQVATVVDYFNRWMDRFPTVEDLAAASVDDVLAQWQGLGYYRRARALHDGAQIVSQIGLPVNAEGWRALPGIGPYTAGAICSIALGQPEALVDGNVERVYSRLTADSAAGAELTKRAWDWARQNLDQSNPGDWNQALMELGAIICTPTSPRCGLCPVSESCAARRADMVENFPTKAPRKATVPLTHFLWIPVRNGQIGIEQIPAGEWWEGMWSFPRATSIQSLQTRFPGVSATEIGSLKHAVTHHRIELTFAVIRVESDLRWLNPEEIEQVAMPAPHRKALQLAQKSGYVPGSTLQTLPLSFDDEPAANHTDDRNDRDYG